MNKIIALMLLGIAAFLTTPSTAYAESYQDKVEFASYLEETLGHFWAIEQNLEEKNAELALVHATHPIAELYELMKPQLKAADPQLDAQIQDTLLQLKDKATTDVSREQAQKAVDKAKKVVEIARSMVVGDELSNDPAFKAELIKTLLNTSIGEYSEAISNGVIAEMAEFQDGSAFVWRSQQIFETIREDVDPNTAKRIDASYATLWNAYDTRSDPNEVKIIINELTGEINKEFGVKEQETDLLVYVENIRDLLGQTKQAYSNGDNELALSLATKAYLDNYEFLEAPLIEMDQKDLMEEVEVMMRVELRDMIKEGKPASEINTQADIILKKMDEVAVAVPEFGTIAMMVLTVAIISIVAVTARSKISIRV